MCVAALLLRFFFFFQAEDGIRDVAVTGVQTCALPISNVEARYAVLNPTSMRAAASPSARAGAAATEAMPASAAIDSSLIPFSVMRVSHHAGERMGRAKFLGGNPRFVNFAPVRSSLLLG